MITSCSRNGRLRHSEKLWLASCLRICLLSARNRTFASHFQAIVKNGQHISRVSIAFSSKLQRVRLLVGTLGSLFSSIQRIPWSPVTSFRCGNHQAGDGKEKEGGGKQEALPLTPFLGSSCSFRTRARLPLAITSIAAMLVQK